MKKSLLLHLWLLSVVIFAACKADFYYPTRINDFWWRDTKLPTSSDLFFATQFPDSSVAVVQFDALKAYVLPINAEKWIETTLPDPQFLHQNNDNIVNVSEGFGTSSVLVVRGLFTNNVWSVQTNVLDLSNNDWQTVQSPPSPPDALISLPDGTVVALLSTRGSFFSLIYTFNKSRVPQWQNTGTWHFGKKPSVLRIDDSRILISGGQGGTTTPAIGSREVYGSGNQTVFDAQTQTVSAAPSISPRWGHVLSKVNDSEFVVAGHADYLFDYQRAYERGYYHSETFQLNATSTTGVDSIRYLPSSFVRTNTIVFNETVYVLNAIEGIVQSFSAAHKKWEPVTAAGNGPAFVFPRKGRFLVLMSNGSTLEIFDPRGLL